LYVAFTELTGAVIRSMRDALKSDSLPYERLSSKEYAWIDRELGVREDDAAIDEGRHTHHLNPGVLTVLSGIGGYEAWRQSAVYKRLAMPGSGQRGRS